MAEDLRFTRSRAIGLAVACALTAAAGAAHAQSASSSYSGFSKSASGYESPVNVATRDANGNMEIVNGVMQAPAGSIFSNLASSGVSSSATGGGTVASGQATAIGNNLNVTVSGEYNTVIVNSSQTNTGAVTATTTLNGKVNLDDGQ